MNYPDHFLGYHLAAGECGEWAYAWRNYTQSDYSEAQRAAFRKWRHDPGAEIPRDWRRKEGDDGFISDPLLADYMRLHSEVVADAICHFARLAKEELARLGREKIVAVFYGYHFTPPGNPSAFFNSGHHALAKVLASPDVDVICAPYSYYAREAGGTSWYMDWIGSNWYRDDDLMADITATQRLARQRLDLDNASVVQIAVIVDEAVVTRLQHDPALINRWTLERMTDLWRSGSPVDVFLKTDLPKIDRRQYSSIAHDTAGLGKE